MKIAAPVELHALIKLRLAQDMAHASKLWISESSTVKGLTGVVRLLQFAWAPAESHGEHLHQLLLVPMVACSR